MAEEEYGTAGRVSPASDCAAPRVAVWANPVRQRSRRRAGRILSWVAAVTSVALLATAGGAWVLLGYYDDRIRRVDVWGDRDRDRPAGDSAEARNILLVGSDSRGDLKPGEGTQGTGDKFVTGQRSDTIILAHLYGDADAAQLVSFPRDAWVEIPAHTDPESGEIVPARFDRLNRAFEGGPALLIETIEDLTGLFVDNYMQIDFDGFQSVVNKLDGVEVCLSEPAKEKDSGIDLDAGRQVIKGEQALAFVRQRTGLPRGDIDRIARQQQFIGAIVRKVLSAGTLANPVKLHGVITVATESIEVDDSLGIGDLQNLAARMRGVDAGRVVFATAPIADPNVRQEGKLVVLLDPAAGEALWDRLRQDELPDTPESESEVGGGGDEPLTVSPASIHVKVFNGAGVQGLGRQAATDLTTVGFRIAGTPDDRGTGATGTVVLHGPDKADSARTLVAAVPGATTRLDRSLDRTLEIVIGSAYSGTHDVTSGFTPATKPPADPPSTPPEATAATDPCAL